MIKENISEKLKPMAYEMKKLMDEKTLEANETIHIRIHQNPEVIEIRLETSSGNYYYYPLDPDYTEPLRCKPKERYYMFDFTKTYRKGWKKK